MLNDIRELQYQLYSQWQEQGFAQYPNCRFCGTGVYSSGYEIHRASCPRLDYLKTRYGITGTPLPHDSNIYRIDGFEAANGTWVK